MSIWASLFSSGDTISKATDAVINTGDKLFFTDEEKAEMNYKMREQHIKMLDAFAPFKIAQRILAIWYSFLFGLVFLIALVMKYYGQDIQPLIEIVKAFSLDLITLSIVSFYFLGGSIASLRRE